NLILDLSGNGGGYLEVAVRLSDQFLSDDKLLVYTEGEHSSRYEHTASDPGKFEKGKLAILIDEGSASASEIVSGAVQDWDRGVIIGRRSFGKGLVQKPFMLSDSSLIRLTIARYHTPTGRMIQKPYKNGYEEYRKDIIKRLNKGELMSQDSIHFPDSLQYKTLKNKRPIYGGGGIMPDYFIPLDTTHITDFYRKIMAHGFLNRFVLNYVDDHRKTLNKKYPDFSAFKEHFTVPQALVDKLVQYAEEKGLTPLPNELKASKTQIKHMIKSYIARDLWEMNDFYQILNEENEAIQEALKILRSNERYTNILTGKKQ
ncbi:MAG: S41 family peptidase, partial [bacterium]